MDGTSRGKLVTAGYAVYRTRDVLTVSGVGETYEIREKSNRGDWVLYGTYPTKAARERAWKELAQDPMHIMEGDTGSPDTSEALVASPVEGPVRDSWEKDKEHEYEVFRASAEASVNGAAMRENLERLLRVMFLRQAKEHLKPLGLWTRYCDETGVDIRNADYEIAKLGDLKDGFLQKFGSHVKFDLNKLRHLANGDSASCSQKLGVTIENGQLMVKGEAIPLTPEDVQEVVNALQEDIRKAEERAAKAEGKAAKEQADARKAVKKAEKELQRIKSDAAKAGLTPVEQAFAEELESVKKDFDELMLHIDSRRITYLEGAEPPTSRMKAAYTVVMGYMYGQLLAATEAEEERKQ